MKEIENVNSKHKKFVSELKSVLKIDEVENMAAEDEELKREMEKLFDELFGPVED